MADSASVVLPCLNPLKKILLTCAYGESGPFFNGQLVDLHLEQCIKPVVTIAFISLINCVIPSNAIN